MRASKDIGIMLAGLLGLLLAACAAAPEEPMFSPEPVPAIIPSGAEAPTPLPEHTETPQQTVIAPPGPIDITIETATGVMGGPVVNYCFPNDCPGELDRPPLDIDHFALLARDHHIRLDLRGTSPSYVALRLYAYLGGRLDLRETTGFEFPGSTVEWTPEWSLPGRYVLEAEIIWGDSAAVYWFTVILPEQGAPDGEPPDPPEAWLVREDGTRVELVREIYCWKDRSGEDLCDVSPAAAPDEYLQLNEGETIRVEFEQPGPQQSSISFVRAYRQDLPGSVGFPGVGGISGGVGPQGWEYQPEPGDYSLSISSVWEDDAHASYHLLISMPGELPPTLEPYPPDVKLLLPGGQTVNGIRGSFCWPTLGCGDGPPPGMTQFSLLGGDRVIRLRFEQPVPARVALALHAAPWDPEEQIEPAAEVEFELLGETFEWLPNAPPGDYVLEVFAKWDPDGDSWYWFGVTIP